MFHSNNLIVRSDDLQIKEQIKSVGEHMIEISPYVDIKKSFIVKVIKN